MEWFAFGLPLLGFLLYVGTVALVLWIGYKLVRSAVKNGILDADAERERRGNSSR